jgi:hypothetical protein
VGAAQADPVERPATTTAAAMWSFIIRLSKSHNVVDLVNTKVAAAHPQNACFMSKVIIYGMNKDDSIIQ